ncbi:endo alpha-1,4 polygalactosaminidase [Jatrophihabitans sp.]|uniref:endo alpha-1,4 polygalactosaminidase n=1 Tax=Jatrophihabitans sp. TaxID=1932789 RepID=UPI0030C77E40
MLIVAVLALTVGCSSAAAPVAAPAAPAGQTASTGKAAPDNTTTATAEPSLPKVVLCSTCYHPPVRTSWNWVLQRVPKAPFRKVALYDIDGFDASAATVAALHKAHIKAVCYLSAGTYENWRPDATKFPAKLIGASDGWPGERWLDVRDVQRSGSPLRSIMDKRLDMCAKKGFDMVELDNVDGYTNKSGFPLTARDQLYYNETLANDAHRRGLSVLQKNDSEQIPTLVRYFDGALNEQCNQFHECTTKQNGNYGLDQYVKAGKPVFQAEYSRKTSTFCKADNAADFNGVRFALALDDSRFQPCR